MSLTKAHNVWEGGEAHIVNATFFLIKYIYFLINNRKKRDTTVE